MPAVRRRLVAPLAAFALGAALAVAPTPSPSPVTPTAPGAGGTALVATTPTLSPRVVGTVITRIPTSRRVVALTFDGGSAAQALTPVLRTLAAKGVKATFFVTGDFARRFPVGTRAIVTRGHLIGNHSMTHPHFTRLTTTQVRSQVTQAATAITSVTGVHPMPWFRFPYGEYDTRTLAAVNGLGYTAIGWTVDTLGWKGRSAGTADDVVRRVLAARRPGMVVLMHLGAAPDGSTLDAAALPTVIDRLRALGYGFVTMRALAPYAP